MESIKLRIHVGEDGVLQIKLPPEIANKELDVVVVFQPVEEFSKSTTKTPEELGYSRRFFEEVIGSWEGEALERPEQLPLAEREEIKWPTS